MLHAGCVVAEMRAQRRPDGPTEGEAASATAHLASFVMQIDSESM